MFLGEFPLFLFMQPKVLTLVTNPLVCYNKCKAELFGIIRSMFEVTNRSVLVTLLSLAIALRLASASNSNEEEELKDESSKIEMIICSVFQFSSFDDPLNVMAVILPTFPSLGSATLKHSYVANILNDGEFVGICLKHDITAPFGCGAILDRITSLFWGFAYCEDFPKVASGAFRGDQNLASQDRSLRVYVSMMFSRSSPAQMMFLEGSSKLLLLFAVAYVSLLVSYNDASGTSGVVFVILTLFFSVFYEVCACLPYIILCDLTSFDIHTTSISFRWARCWRHTRLSNPSRELLCLTLVTHGIV